MSVFRNFSKVISQATLNSGNRTYMLKLTNSIQNPTLFALSQGTPPQDIFQLSLAAYHLVRKAEAERVVLQQIEGESAKNQSLFADAQERLENACTENDRLANQYVNELKKTLRSNVTNLPVHNAIQALYALEATNNADATLYEEQLFPLIREKLQYASLHNLIELAGILSNGQHYKDKALWNGVLEQLDAKFDRPGPKYVKYSGWTLDSYEIDTPQAADGHNTEQERYWAERKDGSKHFAELKSEVRGVLDLVRGNFLYRLLQRETRISTALDNFQERLEREKLRKSLEGARNAGIKVDDVIGRLRS